MLESREEYIPLVREERQHEAQLEAKMDAFKSVHNWVTVGHARDPKMETRGHFAFFEQKVLK